MHIVCVCIKNKQCCYLEDDSIDRIVVYCIIKKSEKEI